MSKNDKVKRDYNAGTIGIVDKGGIHMDWYLINGKWHHCVSIVSKNELKRYVDGMEQKDVSNE